MPNFDFLIPKRPLSHQTKDKIHLGKWREYVHARAYQERPLGLPWRAQLRFTLVYLCESDPPDINNIIKPIQDALNGLVYVDVGMIVDVQGHLRMLDEPLDVIGLPPLLQEAVFGGVDCVYVRVDEAKPLSTLL